MAGIFACIGVDQYGESLDCYFGTSIINKIIVEEIVLKITSSTGTQ
jgi:hypothetical protein